VQRDIEAKSKTRWALYKPVSPVTAAAPKLTDGMEHSTKPSPVNGLLTTLFRAELPILKRRPLPFGTSAYAIGVKR